MNLWQRLHMSRVSELLAYLSVLSLGFNLSEDEWLKVVIALIAGVAFWSLSKELDSH